MRERFWERHTLDELDDEEWEALCDGCGFCCLLKLEDDESGDIATLNVACQLLDTDTCRCSDYDNRFQHVPGCTKLTRDNLSAFRWLPASCAYRRLAEGRKLAAWHPLIAGDATRMHRKQKSVRHFAVSERDVSDDDLEDHIIDIIPCQ